MKNLKMKKIFIGVASIFSFLLVIGIGTFLVNANNVEPNISIYTETMTVDTFENGVFDLNIKIRPGQIKGDLTNVSGLSISDVNITLNSDDFMFLSGEGDIKKVETKKITLNDIKYTYNNDNSNMLLLAPEFNINLKVKPLKTGVYEKEKSLDKIIKLNYKDIKGNQISNKKLETEDEISINVDKIEYKAPEILAGDPPKNKAYFGEVIELNYNLKFPELYTTIKGNNENQQRKVIYLVDEGALEKVDNNGEKVRDSLIKSLETSKANNEFALISYGSKAEIIKNEDKSFYGKDKLIEGVKAIEVDEKNGNLGDGLRVVQTLINEDKNSEISVVLISEGNPAYYLVDSNENKISEFSSKVGESRSDFKKGEEYALEIAKLINEANKENDVRWFNINYGLDEKQEIPNKIIEELNGINSRFENPTIEALSEINEQATADFILQGYLTAEAKKGVRVSPLSSTQKVSISYRYKKNSAGDIETNQQGQKILEPINKENQSMKVGVKILSNKKIDVASKEVLEVSFVSELDKQNKSTFNDGNEKVKWEIDIETSFLKVSGLHTGKLKGIELTGKDNAIDEFAELEKIAAEILDGINASYYPLARDNSFRLGSILKVKSDVKIDLEIDKQKILENNPNVEEVNWIIYKLNKDNNSFDELASKKLDEVKILNKDEIYLIVTDCTLKEKAEIGSNVNFSYNLEQHSTTSTEANLLNDSDSLEAKYFEEETTDINEESQRNKLGTIDTTVVVTEKPEHY